MSYVDPDCLFTREELLEKIWAKRLSPAQRAQCLEEAIARGLTYMDLMREMAAEHDAAMKDPIQRERWHRICREKYRQEAMPLGNDPLLEQGGAHE